MKKEKTKNPVVATMDKIQTATQLRVILEKMEKNLPKEKALKLAKRIRPVMTQFQDENLCFALKAKTTGDKYWVDGGKIYNQSYTFLGFDKKHFYEKAENLTKVATITTYHECSYPVFLKPSVYEVLYQIPQELLDEVVAFELFADSCFVNDIYDSNLNRHRLVCVLYSGTMPKSVADKEIIW